MKADALRLRYRVRFRDFPLGDIEWAIVEAGWRWAAVRLRHAGGQTVISGLSPADARQIAAALEAARAAWWRRALAPQLDALRSVHDRLAQFEDPPGYLSLSGFREAEAGQRNGSGRDFRALAVIRRRTLTLPNRINSMAWHADWHSIRTPINKCC